MPIRPPPSPCLWTPAREDSRGHKAPERVWVCRWKGMRIWYWSPGSDIRLEDVVDGGHLGIDALGGPLKCPRTQLAQRLDDPLSSSLFRALSAGGRALTAKGRVDFEPPCNPVHQPSDQHHHQWLPVKVYHAVQILWTGRHIIRPKAAGR